MESRKASVPVLVLAFASLTVAVSRGAVVQQIDLDKGDTVCLEVPALFFQLDGHRTWDGSPIYVVNITPTENGVAVGGKSDWRISGFPSGLELKVEKAKREDDYTEVELRTRGVNVKLRFSRAITDVNAALREVVALGPASGSEMQSYLKDAYDALGYFIFQGPLATVPDDARQELLRFAHLTAEGTGLSHERFRGSDYLAVDLGTDSNVWRQSTRKDYRVLDRVLFVDLQSYNELQLGQDAARGEVVE